MCIRVSTPITERKLWLIHPICRKGSSHEASAVRENDEAAGQCLKVLRAMWWLKGGREGA